MITIKITRINFLKETKLLIVRKEDLRGQFHPKKHKKVECILQASLELKTFNIKNQAIYLRLSIRYLLPRLNRVKIFKIQQ